MKSVAAMPCCPRCKAQASRVSWRSGRGGGPVEVTLQPCGHVVMAATEPEMVVGGAALTVAATP